MKRVVLCDSDTLIYEAAMAAEVATEWDDGMWTLHAFLEPAIAQLEGSIKEIRDALDADVCVMTLSDYVDPWRKKVMPTYKRERNKTRKPVIFKPLREYLHESYPTYQRPGLEGDDVLGILATSPGMYPGDEKLVLSIDKDMNTLPGKFVNLKRGREKGEWFPKEISEAQADYFHMKQTVMGDPTDGYPGCPKIGPVSADKLLAPFVVDDDTFDAAGAWTAIVGAYAKQGLGVEVALQNARVARICRNSDYNFDTKEVILWQPPTN